MTNLKIAPTQYTREDGLEILHLRGVWVTRARVDGMLRFYNSLGQWVLASQVDLRWTDSYGRTLEQAMALLETLPDVRSL